MIIDNSKMSALLLHKANKRIVLNLIKNEGIISRSEVTLKTGLTPPTVAKIVKELVEKYNLVEYKGIGESNGGRPPVILNFNNENNHIIGLDLGATYIRGCLVDMSGRIISDIQMPTEMEKGFESVIDKLAEIVNKLLNRKGGGDRVWGIGIGVAGLVNSKTGFIEFSPVFGWENINLREELEKRLPLPFLYDNSTRLMAVGELNLGENRCSNFSVINVGYGIATGLVVDGNLVGGNEGFAGEFGHIVVDNSSKVKCKCGQYGCLEALASGHRIATLGKAMFEKNETEVLGNLCNGNSDLISAEIVGKAYRQGDPSAIKIFNETTEYLAQGIGTIVNLLNPKIVYLGGGISLNGEFFFDLLKEKVPNYLLKSNRKLEILPSSFGEHATAIGAASLVLDKVMKLEFGKNGEIE